MKMGLLAQRKKVSAEACYRINPVIEQAAHNNEVVGSVRMEPHNRRCAVIKLVVCVVGPEWPFSPKELFITSGE
jgi:hypothetical protein